jgi:hypothetical protein
MKSFSRVFPAALPKFIDCGYLAFLGTFQWKRQTSGFSLRTYLTVCVCVCVCARSVPCTKRTNLQKFLSPWNSYNMKT